MGRRKVGLRRGAQWLSLQVANPSLGRLGEPTSHPGSLSSFPSLHTPVDGLNHFKFPNNCRSLLIPDSVKCCHSPGFLPPPFYMTSTVRSPEPHWVEWPPPVFPSFLHSRPLEHFSHSWVTPCSITCPPQQTTDSVRTGQWLFYSCIPMYTKCPESSRW